MKAVILAAGYNSRLKDVIDIPKSLLKIGSTTILERQINILRKAGFEKEDIFVVAGYKHEMIEAVHDNIILNEKYIEYDVAYSVYLALNKLNPKDSEEIFFFDGDLVYDEKMIKPIIDSDKKNILVTKEELYSPDCRDEIILADDNSKIEKVIFPEKGKPLDEKYRDKRLFRYVGIVKLSGKNAKKLRNRLDDSKILKGWHTRTFVEMVNEDEFYNFPIDKNLKFCFDVDNKEDFERLSELDFERLNELNYKIFVAGPVSVQEEVKEAMVYKDICHREKEFEDLFNDVKEKLLFAFGVDSKSDEYGVVVIGGSGTSAMETILASVLHKDKQTLVVSNGAYGERINDICNLHDIKTSFLDYGWKGYPNLKDIEQKLQQDKNIEAVAVVLLETSTGMLNPIKQIGELCKKYNKILIVDAISGLAGENFNMREFNVDYCIGSANKGIGGVPTLGLICFKRSVLEKSRDVKPRSYYLDLFKHIKYSEENSQTPFTPQIPLFFMMNKALDYLLEEGVKNRVKRYQNNAHIIREKLKEMNLKIQHKDGERSLLTINMMIPKNYTYEEISSKLKEQSYIVYPGKGPLTGKIIHIAGMGVLQEEDVLNFCKAMREAIKYKIPEY